MDSRRICRVFFVLASCGDTYFLGNLPPAPRDASNDGTPTFGCDGCALPAPYDPCAGKVCGAPCAPCPSTEPMCAGAADAFWCDSNGACSTMASACDGGASYDPCAGKACGGDAGCSSCAAR